MGYGAHCLDYGVFLLVFAVVSLAPLWAEVPAPDGFSLFDGETKVLADGSRGPFRFFDRAIDRGSEQVWVSGVIQERDRDYTVNADRALLTFYKQVPRGAEIVVRFRQVPQVVGPVYRRRVMSDSGAVFVPRSVVNGPVATFDDDAPQLDIGGSKRIAVTFGSDRDHTVNQALQMRISGEVADGVSVLAVLSDRNLPVSESGNTRALRELDRVFFQVQSGGMLAELGDLDVAFQRTTFGQYRRQLQGGRLSLSQSGYDATLLGAVSRGQWVSQRIASVEGYQGPYRLPGGGGLLGRIVPESERVYVNGQLLRQGDRLDYVVDYELGTLTFAPEMPIETETRITVDYQILEEGVRSRLVGGTWDVRLGPVRLVVGTTWIRESDTPVLGDGVVSEGSDALRQVGVIHAAFAPRDGVHLAGEVALSDRDAKQGQAFRLDGQWTSVPSAKGQIYTLGRFRQVGAGFEGFERYDLGASEGRWGWQSVVGDSMSREGEVGVGYRWDDRWVVEGFYGRRSGVLDADRRSAQVVFPLGRYEIESIGLGGGHLTRQNGRLSYALGWILPGFQFQLENANGLGVSGASIFYAGRPMSSLPEGVGIRELRWDVETGQKGHWLWRSELRHRSIRQKMAVWQDSLQAWSQSHRAELTGYHGWSFSGAYSRSAAVTGGQRQVTHLGRSQVRFHRPGFAHQVSYRISRVGVQNRTAIFVDVGRGLGTYLWEDVNGDGIQDPEEFVPDVDGNYDLIYTDDGAFQPARDGALGVRMDVDFNRLISNAHWLSQVSTDVSLTADRQTAPGTLGVAPWQLFGFSADSTMLSGQRDLWARVYLFRYHKRGSLQFSGRWRDRVSRLFSGGAESQSEGRVLGRLRLGRRWDLETEMVGGVRGRAEAGAFEYDILSWSGNTRSLWRPVSGWQMQLAVTGGRDRERMRNLQAVYVSVEPEMIRALPGRGRVRSSLDWTRVSANAPMPLFLGLAEGHREGQNWVWRLGMDYRFGKFVTALVRYDGRKRPGVSVVHLGQVEVKAVF